MTRQKIGDDLEYSYVYHKLFQRAEAKELSAERKRQIYKERFEWSRPDGQARASVEEGEAREDKARGPFPNGRVAHSFDPERPPTRRRSRPMAAAQASSRSCAET